MKKEDLFKLRFDDFCKETNLQKLIENAPERDRENIKKYLEHMYSNIIAPMVNNIGSVVLDKNKMSQLEKIMFNTEQNK